MNCLLLIMIFFWLNVILFGYEITWTRSPVEMSCMSVESLFPFHTATASALLTSMLSAAPRTCGWTLEGIIVFMNLLTCLSCYSVCQFSCMDCDWRSWNYVMRLLVIVERNPKCYKWCSLCSYVMADGRKWFFRRYVVLDKLNILTTMIMKSD